jgi:hypothetical protein
MVKLTVYGSGLLRAYAAAATDESVPFLSSCANCGQPRLQVGYSLLGLLRSLEAGLEIHAWCLPCDLVWQVTLQERAAIARGLLARSSVMRR